MSSDIRMTAAEVKLLVSDTVEEALTKHMDRCPILKRFETLHTDMYGVPGNKDISPGAMGDIADLKHSRRNLIWGLRAVWGVLVSTPVIAWIISHFTTAAK